MENNAIEDGRIIYAKGHFAGARSGLLTGVAADAAVYALRNVNQGVNLTTEELVVDSVKMAFVTTTSATGAQQLAFSLYKATGFTAILTGGKTVTPIRKRTADNIVLPTTQVQIAIANAGALAGAAFTIDAEAPLETLICDLDLTSAAGGATSGTTLWTPFDGIPISLGPDEGLIVTCQVAMGAALVGRLYVTPELRLL